MNSAFCPFAVWSITHGATLAAAPLGPWSVAREELIAASPATAAAVNNKEQKIGRQRGVLNIRFNFVIIRIGIARPARSKAGCSRLVDLFVQRHDNRAGDRGVKRFARHFRSIQVARKNAPAATWPQFMSLRLRRVFEFQIKSDEQREAAIVLFNRKAHVVFTALHKRSLHWHADSIAFLPRSRRALVERGGLENNAQGAITLAGHRQIVMQPDILWLRTGFDLVDASRGRSCCHVVSYGHSGPQIRINYLRDRICSSFPSGRTRGSVTGISLEKSGSMGCTSTGRSFRHGSMCFDKLNP